MRKFFTLTLLTSFISVWAVSPYVNKVYEYVPAPGQFINYEYPHYVSGDTEASMLAKVNDALVGKASGSLICLGAFGGYVTVGFDHPIVNLEGEKDFIVYGNAFLGNAEPGVIWVMKDVNGNGLPDDTWYEIAGSEYNNPETKHNYQITYYKPSAEDDAATIAIDKYIRWTDNLGGEGYISKNTHHTQSYYPKWITAESYTLKGTLLPKNATFREMWVLNAFEYGYADNWPNNNENAKINIEWAVDSEGNPANLDQIDFIRVHTGESQVFDNIGETSTEVSGVADLHPNASAVEETAENVLFIINPFSSEIQLSVKQACTAVAYDLCGKCVLTAELAEGFNSIPASNLHKGTYILKIGDNSFKIIKL